MNKRSIEYMMSHDMDFVFTADNRIIHCATHCSILPDKCREIKKLNLVNRVFREFRMIFLPEEVEVNREMISGVIQTQMTLINRFNEQRDNDDIRLEISSRLIELNYTSSFLTMACRGAWSYDYLGPLFDNGSHIAERFILVASPPKKHPLRSKLLESNLEVLKDSCVLPEDDNALYDLTASVNFQGSFLDITLAS